MKLTKSKLKKIIKEELSIMTEGGGRPYDPTVPGDWQRQQAMISGEHPEPPDDPAARVAAAIGISLDELTATLEAEGLAIVTAEEAAPEMSPDQEEDLKLATKRDYWTRGSELPGRSGLPRGYES